MKHVLFLLLVGMLLGLWFVSVANAERLPESGQEFLQAAMPSCQPGFHPQRIDWCYFGTCYFSPHPHRKINGSQFF